MRKSLPLIYFFAPVIYSLLFFSCINKQKTMLSDDDQRMAMRQRLFESQSLINMKDSTILLGLKLQCTKHEYYSSIDRLLKDKKIHKVHNKHYYLFNLKNNIKAKGFLNPVFYKDRLVKLDISAEWDNPNILYSDVVLFVFLDELFSSKYEKFEDVRFNVPESYIYEHDWYGDGKHISLSSGNISYSCAKGDDSLRIDVEKANSEIRQKELDNI